MSRSDQGTASALETITWAQLQKIRGSAAPERQTHYRIKHGCISLWTADSSTSCPHPACQLDTTPSVRHVFWDCIVAQDLWDTLLDPWRRLGWTPELREFHAVFALSLQQVPSHATGYLIPKETTHAERETALDCLFPLLWTTWRMLILAAIHCNWCWRLGALHDADLSPAALRLKAFARVSAKLKLLPSIAQKPDDPASLAVERKMAWTITSYFSAASSPIDPAAPPATSSKKCFLLFFDGGSRGNPGPGGSGSVIVRLQGLHVKPVFIWYACMAYSSKPTTNNVAEYWGLIHGLQYARQQRIKNLTVIGDSQLILQQLQQYRMRKSAHLQGLYLRARRCATEIAVAPWNHRRRKFNQMADAAANIAMTTRRSIQTPTSYSREEAEIFLPLLQGDVDHWTASSSSSPGHSR